MSQVWALSTIAICGAAGALARFGLIEVTRKYLGDAFPWGTLFVNIAGCFVIGLAHAAFEAKPSAELTLRYGLMIGFLGAFTTFSAFGLDTLKLFHAGQADRALLNILASVALCLGAVWLGIRVGKMIW